MNGQKKKHADKITFTVMKVGAGNSAKEIADAKLKSHGIVAKDKDGNLLTKVDGHSYGQEKVEEVVALLLAEKKKATE